MGRPTLANSRDTKAELLRTAMELVQKRGYNAFSYQDLSELLNISKASIHYYFPSKEDLGVSLMEFGQNRFQAWTESIQDKTMTATEALQAYFSYYAKISAEGTQVCPGGAMLAEWNTLPERLRTAAEALSADHRQWVTAVLERGRKQGEFTREGSLDEQYRFVRASIQGSLQIGRSEQRAEYLRTVTKQVLAALKAQ
jgi:TetR/AcrR family transcriptional repressor of nem operon